MININIKEELFRILRSFNKKLLQYQKYQQIKKKITILSFRNLI